MAARKHLKVHDVEQTKKMVPLITCEITLSQQVHKLVFGVYMFGLDFGVQSDPIKQPIQRNSVGSGRVSDSPTSAFDEHFDHRFIVFKKIQLHFNLRRVCVCDNAVHIWQFVNNSIFCF